MMAFLYNFGIAIYTISIRLASLFNPKAKAWVKGRHGWKNLLANTFNEDEKVIWFHAASLGEFEQGRPVIESVRKEYPDHKILLTFFSPSGYEQKKGYEGADMVMYLPPDCPGNARFFVKAIQPTLAIFIKYEFWYNYLTNLKDEQVPVVFISALFRKDQPFFKWYGAWFRRKLSNVDHFFVQDQASADKLDSIGIGQHSVSGDTRFDRVADILANKKENKDVAVFCKGHKVLLAGSTWPQDEDILAAVPKKFADLKLIIAPHEVKEERIKQLIHTIGTDVCRYTKDDPASWTEKQVLIIDTIGVLSSIYRYADIAYIGGGFGTGLHNIQEPAVNGIPVVFGPQYEKFREAVDLVDLGGAFSITAAGQAVERIGALLDDREKYQIACETCRSYMIEQTGATKKILKGISNYL